MRRAGLLAVLLGALALQANRGPAASAQSAVPRYGLFEAALPSYATGAFTDPIGQVQASVTFTAPSGRTFAVEGYLSGASTFRVRFQPWETGTYQYSGRIGCRAPCAVTNAPGAVLIPPASFTVTPSSDHGPIRRVDASNRLVFDDGAAFYGVGIQDCWPQSGTLSGSIGDPSREPTGESGNVSLDQYFASYQGGGFNLFRLDNGNCMGRYEVDTTANATGPAGAAVDALLTSARAHGFHTQYGIWESPNAGQFAQYGNVSTDAGQQARLTRELRYLIARFGALADVFEFANESCNPADGPSCFYSNLSDAALATAVSTFQTLDPYGRLLTNSNPRGSDAATGLTVQSPHTYYQSGDWAQKFTGGALPTIAGEAGRQPGGAGAAPYGTREVNTGRLTEWTAFLGGAGVIWWNTSFSATCCNQYLGATERRQTKALADWAAHFDAGYTVTKQATSGCVTSYRIESISAQGAYAYCQNGMQGGAVGPQRVNVTITVPGAGTASWLSPSTGLVLASQSVSGGAQTLTSPPFTEDVALLITGGGAAPATATAVPATRTATPVPTSTPAPSATPAATATPVPAPVDCPITLERAVLHYSVSGAMGETMQVDVPAGCSWFAAGNQTWLIVEAPTWTGGNDGSGTVRFDVYPNATGRERQGGIAIVPADPGQAEHGTEAWVGQGQ